MSDSGQNASDNPSGETQTNTPKNGEGRAKRKRRIALLGFALGGFTVFSLFTILVQIGPINIVFGDQYFNPEDPDPGVAGSTPPGPDVSLPAGAEGIPKPADPATATTQLSDGTIAPPESTTTTQAAGTPDTTTAPESTPDTTTGTTDTPETTDTPDTTTRTTAKPVAETTAPPERPAREFYAEPFLADLDEDEPGGEYSWWRPDNRYADSGFGNNGFWFTLAYGGSDTIDNFARWDFEVPQGTYDVQVYVPLHWATAEIEYLIWVDENGDNRFSAQENRWSRWLNQAERKEWQSLGEFTLEGRVRVEVHDTRSTDDWRVDGVVNSRLAADAMRLIEVVGR
ncbi:MAG: hypothetical protein F4091_12220 [Acidimicrobiales bacterium]|nr:hypothetical protein [Acidimicrobiales bacterium]MYD83226.1 hypothetical protein [Acidimicrobiales bacterium]MYJ66208.1 hypothetical protein [Acidimicrobiales bacterium]